MTHKPPNTFRLFAFFLFFIFFCTPLAHADPQNDTLPHGHKKKILFIIPSLSTGGIERAFVNMINAMHFRAEDIDICIFKSDGVFVQLLPKEIPLITIEQAKKNDYDYAVSYAHYFYPHIWVPTIHAKRKIQWCHYDFSYGPGCVDWDKEVGIDQFVCVVQKSLENMKKVHPKTADRVRVIYNIIDEKTIRAQAEEPISDMPKDDPTILTVVSVARFTHEKGIDRLVKIHKRLRDDGLQLHWYIIGDGEERAFVEKLIKENEVEKTFTLLGSKPNPYPYIKQADLFVLPSLYESFGFVITEAKILGTPILATDTCGAREQLVSETNGLIVANNNDALYEGVRRMLLQKHLRNTFKENLRSFTYDNSKSVQAIHELFNSSSL